MSAPFSADSRRPTTNVIVELSPSQIPPTLPFELRDHVSPNNWEIRVSALSQLASQYCRPNFERAYLVAILLLTLLVPITTYYVTLQALEDTTSSVDEQLWLARFIAFGVTIATWVILSLPIVAWKYFGKLRVRRLADHWNREDALAAPSYNVAPVWMASTPGLFRDVVVLTVTVPQTKKSQFDRDSYLPPYVSASSDGLPAYSDSKVAQWSKDFGGRIKYGDLPIYTDNSTVV